MATAKDVTALIRELRELGIDVKKAKSGHWQAFREGIYVATFPATPNDYRTMLNVKANLRRIGINLKRK